MGCTAIGKGSEVMYSDSPLQALQTERPALDRPLYRLAEAFSLAVTVLTPATTPSAEHSTEYFRFVNARKQFARGR